MRRAILQLISLSRVPLVAFRYPRFGGDGSVLHILTWITVLCFNHLSLQYQRFECGFDLRFHGCFGVRCLEGALDDRRLFGETSGLTPVSISCHDSLFDRLGVTYQGMNRPIISFESVYTAPSSFFIDETVHGTRIRSFPYSLGIAWTRDTTTDTIPSGGRTADVGHCRTSGALAERRELSTNSRSNPRFTRECTFETINRTG